MSNLNEKKVEAFSFSQVRLAWRIVLGGFVFLFCTPHSLLMADMIWIEGSQTPISGQVVSQTQDQLEFRFWTDNQEQTIQVDRQKVVDLLITVDPKKLESLTPERLEDYLDYAEVLSSFRSDAYAVRTTKRLCMIVARWGQPTDRASAFRLLISVCEGEEKRRVVRLAFVFDPRFELPVDEKGGGTSIDESARRQLGEIVKLIRTEDRVAASNRLNDQSVIDQIEPVFELYSEICTKEELFRLAAAKQLSVSQLSQLLRLEKALKDPVLRDRSARKSLGNDWATASEILESEDARLPDFEYAFSFDLKQTIFRSGRWVAPPK